MQALRVRLGFIDVVGDGTPSTGMPTAKVHGRAAPVPRSDNIKRLAHSTGRHNVRTPSHSRIPNNKPPPTSMLPLTYHKAGSRDPDRRPSNFQIHPYIRVVPVEIGISLARQNFQMIIRILRNKLC